jgi:hypothetical protein
MLLLALGCSEEELPAAREPAPPDPLSELLAHEQPAAGAVHHHAGRSRRGHAHAAGTGRTDPHVRGRARAPGLGAAAGDGLHLDHRPVLRRDRHRQPACGPGPGRHRHHRRVLRVRRGAAPHAVQHRELLRDDRRAGPDRLVRAQLRVLPGHHERLRVEPDRSHRAVRGLPRLHARLGRAGGLCAPAQRLPARRLVVAVRQPEPAHLPRRPAAAEPRAGHPAAAGRLVVRRLLRAPGGAIPIEGGVLATCANRGLVWAFHEEDPSPSWTLQAHCDATVGLPLTRAIPVFIP